MAIVPTDLSGLQRWYDATTITASYADLISTWEDQSSVGADLTAAGTARPRYVTDRWNGMPGVLFSGAQEITSTSTTGQPVDQFTISLVVSGFMRGTFPQMLTWNQAVTSTGICIQGSNAAPLYRPELVVKKPGAWGDIQPSSSVRPGRGDPVIITAFVSAGTGGIRVDGVENTDTGTTGNISYGSSPSLRLGGYGGNNFHRGIIHEAIIYDVKHSSSDIEDLEEYLNLKWGLLLDQANYLALYNGCQDGGSTYSVGFGWSPDGKQFRRLSSGQVLSPGGGGTWDDATVKDPSLLDDGTQWVAYYAGFDGSAYRIGRATATYADPTTWTKEATNPVLNLGSGGAIDDAGCSFPFVMYDVDEADPDRRWKMWYTANDGTKQTCAYAYSDDGLTWVKYGRVLDVGAAATWDDVDVSVGGVRRIDATTWELYYQGNGNSSPSQWQAGLATFSDPESTYTKSGSNPIIASTGTATSEVLTANLLTGAVDVTVADTTGWSVGEEMVVVDDSELDNLRILAVPSGTAATVEVGPENDMTTGAGATMRSMTTRSVILRSVLDDGSGNLVGWGTAFQPVDDLGVITTKLREGALRWTSADGDGPWTEDYLTGLLWMLDDSPKWDHRSAENPSIVSLAIPPGTLTAALGGLTATLTGTVRHHGLLTASLGGLTATLNEETLRHFWEAFVQASPWRADLQTPPTRGDLQP